MDILLFRFALKVCIRNFIIRILSGQGFFALSIQYYLSTIALIL